MRNMYSRWTIQVPMVLQHELMGFILPSWASLGSARGGTVLVTTNASSIRKPRSPCPLPIHFLAVHTPAAVDATGEHISYMVLQPAPILQRDVCIAPEKAMSADAM